MNPRLRAFLVEDSVVIRENLAATLEEVLPLRVVGSAGDEAGVLDWLAHPGSACDLMVVDLFLRSGSGFGVLAAVRESGRDCKLVVFSNYVTPDVRRRCLALGADAVFDKSRDIDALIDYCARMGSAAPK